MIQQVATTYLLVFPFGAASRSEVGGGESFVTPPTGKSCFVFVFALRACVRDATRDQGVSRHVFVPSPSSPSSPSPAAASCRKVTILAAVFLKKCIVLSIR